jgi:D-alanine-D-alanine ligase
MSFLAITHTTSSKCVCHQLVINACDEYCIPYRLFDADKIETINPAPFALFDTSTHYRGIAGMRFYPRLWAEKAGIPVVGSGSAAVRTADNKILCKQVLQTLELPLAKSQCRSTVPSSAERKAIVSQLGLPCIVKANSEHSSVGLSLCNDDAELASAIESSLKIDSPVILEEFVEGAEVYCLMVESLPILPFFKLPISPTAIYTAANKSVNDFPLEQYSFGSNEKDSAIQLMLRRAWDGMGLRGFARFDMRVKADGSAVILELNVKPSLEAGSICSPALATIGLSQNQMIKHLVELAIGRTL